MKSPKLSQKQTKELREFIHRNNRTSKEIKRAQAIIMVDKEIAVADIAALTGLGRSQIFNVRKRYLAHGLKTVEDKNKKNPKELLTGKQRDEIIETVKSKKPSECDKYFSNYDYWTTSVLADLIKRRYDVQYKSKTSLYLVFRQSKFTFHKPGRVYQKRDEEEVKRRQKMAKPIVEKVLTEKNTVILCEDEMILSTQTTI